MSTTSPRVVVERKYGGLTLTEIREELRGGAWPAGIHAIASDLIREIETTEATEVIQRLRRIETKIHRVAVHTGAEPDSTMTLPAEEHRDRVVVYVPGYDVTVAQVRRALDHHEIAPNEKTIFLVQGEALLGTLRLTGRV